MINDAIFKTDLNIKRDLYNNILVRKYTFYNVQVKMHFYYQI